MDFNSIFPSEYFHQTIPCQEISRLKASKLTDSDIDKRVFRIAPAFLMTGIPNNSFVPETLDEINKRAEIFKGFFISDTGERKLKFLEKNFLDETYEERISNFAEDDDNWISVEEATYQLVVNKIRELEYIAALETRGEAIGLSRWEPDGSSTESDSDSF